MPERPGRGSTPIALIFGGVGPEHSISCLSAQSVLEALISNRGDSWQESILCVGIAQNGSWHLVDASEVLSFTISGSELPVVPTNGPQVALRMNPVEPGFLVTGNADTEFVACSSAFPVLHGEGGEDGQVQGALDAAGITFIGSGVNASALCSDKATTKQVLQQVGVNCGEWISVDHESQGEKALQVFGDSNIFVKPATGGSSIGITRVTSERDIAGAIGIALSISPRVIIERAIPSPRELEVAVLTVDGEVVASPVGEIQLKSHFDFYDFEAKYIADGANLITPADLDTMVSERIQGIAVEVFKALGCRDFARVDFLLSPTGMLVVNEVNTIPGFTSISMYSRMWAAAGLTFEELIAQLERNAATRLTDQS